MPDSVDTYIVIFFFQHYSFALFFKFISPALFLAALVFASSKCYCCFVIVCKALAEGIAMVIDTTWDAAWPSVIDALRAINLPYLHIELSIKPYVRAFIKYLEEKNVYDMAAVFQNSKGKLMNLEWIGNQVFVCEYFLFSSNTAGSFTSLVWVCWRDFTSGWRWKKKWSQPLTDYRTYRSSSHQPHSNPNHRFWLFL